MCKYNSCPLELKQEHYHEEAVRIKNFNSNKELNALETREKKIIMESKPVKLMAILTRRCNLRCIMCPRVRDEEFNLPFDLTKKLYTFFPYLEWVSWQGGEVFLVDYFKELFLETAKYPHIKQHIMTNGLLINREWAKIFSQSNVDLLYSIDGVTKDIYEFIRHGAKFEDLIKRLELINEFRGKYGSTNRMDINAIVMRCNYKTLSLFPDFCRKYNFTSLNLNFLCHSTLPEQDILINPDFNALSYLKEIIPQIRNRCREYNIGFKCLFEFRLESLWQNHSDSNFTTGSCLVKEHENSTSDYCIYPWTMAVIEPNGKVKPSCECELSIGDLKENTLEEIWNGRNMQLYRSMISNKRSKEICSRQCLIEKNNDA